jgi:hypothetical protein
MNDVVVVVVGTFKGQHSVYLGKKTHTEVVMVVLLVKVMSL